MTVQAPFKWSRGVYGGGGGVRYSPRRGPRRSVVCCSGHT